MDISKIKPHVASWDEVAHEWADQEKTYSKTEIATNQLRTAIFLFLGENDYASAITLAGAAGEILHQQVVFSGKTPLLEDTRLLCKELIGSVPKRGRYLKNFRDITGIHLLKHKSKICPDTIEIDLAEAAEMAISRAVLDFIKLYGERADTAVESFMSWLWQSRDWQAMMAERKFPVRRHKAQSGLASHSVVDLATTQLRTATILFLTGAEIFSAITLAGAADVLLCRLVENVGKENFTENVLKHENNPEKTKEQIGKEINNMFYINALKHMNDRNDVCVTMNLRAAAIGAILKALPNYLAYHGTREDFIKAFLGWVKANLDPEIYNVDCDPNWKSKKDTL